MHKPLVVLCMIFIITDFTSVFDDVSTARILFSGTDTSMAWLSIRNNKVNDSETISNGSFQYPTRAERYPARCFSECGEQNSSTTVAATG